MPIPHRDKARASCPLPLQRRLDRPRLVVSSSSGLFPPGSHSWRRRRLHPQPRNQPRQQWPDEERHPQMAGSLNRLTRNGLTEAALSGPPRIEQHHSDAHGLEASRNLARAPATSSSLAPRPEDRRPTKPLPLRTRSAATPTAPSPKTPPHPAGAPPAPPCSGGVLRHDPVAQVEHVRPPPRRGQHRRRLPRTPPPRSPTPAGPSSPRHHPRGSTAASPRSAPVSSATASTPVPAHTPRPPPRQSRKPDSRHPDSRPHPPIICRVGPITSSPEQPRRQQPGPAVEQHQRLRPAAACAASSSPSPPPAVAISAPISAGSAMRHAPGSARTPSTRRPPPCSRPP